MEEKKLHSVVVGLHNLSKCCGC